MKKSRKSPEPSAEIPVSRSRSDEATASAIATPTITVATGSLAGPTTSVLARRNLVFGWWSLAVSLSLGIGLEVIHGFKLGWYLEVGNEMRRLMFTLAHAHGTLLALINIAFAVALRTWSEVKVAKSTSQSLVGAGVLLPLGFFLGGLVIHGGDPGVGIVLVPVGAILLLYGVVRAARDFTALKA